MTTTPEVPGLAGNELNDDGDAVFDELARRAGAALRRPAPEDGVSVIAHRRRRQQALKASVVGGVAVATLIGALLVVSTRDDPDGLRPADSLPATLPATTTPAPTPAVLVPVDSSPATVPAATTPPPTPTALREEIAAFTAAIEASGVLTGPSADDVAQATDYDLYRDDFGETQQVSPAGNSVSLRRCRDSASATCGTGWAYITGVAGGGEVHGGLLGEASPVNLHLQLLDDRYFVASESSARRASAVDGMAHRCGIGTGWASQLARRADDTELARAGAAAVRRVVQLVRHALRRRSRPRRRRRGMALLANRRRLAKGGRCSGRHDPATGDARQRGGRSSRRATRHRPDLDRDRPRRRPARPRLQRRRRRDLERGRAPGTGARHQRGVGDEPRSLWRRSLGDRSGR